MKSDAWNRGFRDGAMCAVEFLISAHGEETQAAEFLKMSMTKEDALKASKNCASPKQMKEFIEEHL